MKCDCANCTTHACYTKGVNCTGVDPLEVLDAYTDQEKEIMQAAAYVEGTFYSNITRLQETAEFARAMGYKKLGMAFCIGLNAEARYIARFYKQEGFEFYSVCCKNCSIAKKELGLRQCRPVSLLNREPSSIFPVGFVSDMMLFSTKTVRDR